MIDYIYDGTFEGLLTCIYHHYYSEKAAGIYRKETYQTSMLQGAVEVETEEDKASRVYDAIEKKISKYSLKCIFRAFLSSDPEKENKILNYVLLGFRKGPQTGSLHGNPVVHDIDVINKKVGAEQERMLQFVRFQVMNDNILYAEVEPEHDVIELVADHFAKRFSHDPLIIRDAGRNKAIIAFEGHWYVTPFDGTGLPDGGKLKLSEEEESYQKLWRTYFEHIAIMERKNPRCQRNFMPVRYWKHLTEMQLQGGHC